MILTATFESTISENLTIYLIDSFINFREISLTKKMIEIINVILYFFSGDLLNRRVVRMIRLVIMSMVFMIHDYESFVFIMENISEFYFII